MKNLRSGTLIELLDRSTEPSEAALGELCLVIKECGYDVSEVKDENNSIVVFFENYEMNLNGSIIIDRMSSVFSINVVDRDGKYHNIFTKNDTKAFDYIKKYINEEVELRSKFKKLNDSAKYLLSWIMRQYSTGGIYVFSYNDLGVDIDESTKQEAINSLVDHGFLRMSKNNTLILDRTLADDLRDLIK